MKVIGYWLGFESMILLPVEFDHIEWNYQFMFVKDELHGYSRWRQEKFSGQVYEVLDHQIKDFSLASAIQKILIYTLRCPCENT